MTGLLPTNCISMATLHSCWCLTALKRLLKCCLFPSLLGLFIPDLIPRVNPAVSNTPLSCLLKLDQYWSRRKNPSTVVPPRSAWRTVVSKYDPRALSFSFVGISSMGRGREVICHVGRGTCVHVLRMLRMMPCRVNFCLFLLLLTHHFSILFPIS